MVGAYCSVNPQTRWCAPKVKGAIKLKDPVGLGDLEAADILAEQAEQGLVSG